MKYVLEVASGWGLDVTDSIPDRIEPEGFFVLFFSAKKTHTHTLNFHCVKGLKRVRNIPGLIHNQSQKVLKRV